LFFRSAYRVTPNIDHGLLDLSLKSLFTTHNYASKIHTIDIDSLVKHFKNGLKQSISWYSNIDLNLEISKQWRRAIDIEVAFLFGENDAAVKLNNKMINRLKISGSNVAVKEVKNADHWLPLTHKESVISEII
jgi:pimeloyl-ACP methyl ester carboxylesterase